MWLEWIKVIAPIIVSLSWPVIAVLALFVFREPLLRVIEQLTAFQIQRIKVGPIEFERELIKLADKVEDTKTEQERQQSEIETIRLLTVHFVSDYELSHLRKLASAEPFIFHKQSENQYFFERELRHLQDLSFIANYPDKGIGPLFHEQGEVKHHFYITDAGRKYLELRESLQPQAIQRDASPATH